MPNRRYITLLLLFAGLQLWAGQRFFNLTYDQVKPDSVLPRFTYSIALGPHYADSVYTVTLLYPEYVDTPPSHIAQYNKLSGAALPETPVLHQHIAVNRKQASLNVGLLPLVFRDGRYRTLAGFMLKVDAQPRQESRTRSVALTRATQSTDIYASQSVLSSGRWAKIRVSETGVYELTEALIRQAGFSDLSRVKVYGYGGALQPEAITAAYLQQTDDLQEVPLCPVNGHRLFFARGPVSWDSNTASRRTRNPYSSYGYYFITQGESAAATVDSATFVNSFYPSPHYYHSLYEVDGYSWYHGGRNLFDPEATALGATRRVVLTNTSGSTEGTLSVNVSASTASTVQVSVNGTTMGSLQISLGEYDKGNECSGIYRLSPLSPTGSDTIAITTIAGGPVRLDYVSMAYSEAQPAPRLHGSFKAPEYVCNITPQNLHAHEPADMVIIIPTSQKLLAQARRLKTFHETRDALRVRIVPADELYNEFSSGTPDINAYRRYLKMLYDRAATAADAPRYLLLMGDCVWDNRLLTPECKSLRADDYLLCYESENSFNKITCYVDDGFVCLLDEGEGAHVATADQLDVAVGRFPVSTEAEAKVMVDKTLAYAGNSEAGAWQNTLMFMGDDGNDNLHMDDANETADSVAAWHPGYIVKKVMWDAYTRQSTSTGNTYPDVTKIVKQQQATGALIMDYAGHGAETQLSHESVLKLTDFSSFYNRHLPLWITASCDIMPFDGVTANIGEAAVLNANGGAVAFFGTTRTVYAYYNKRINMAFLKQVLTQSNGAPITLGEAQRLAKNELIATGQDLTTNKLQYSLLGDPALSLVQPTPDLVVDSIDGRSVDAQTLPTLKAGSVVRVTGHVSGDTGFNGLLTATVRDSREQIVCKLNDPSEADEAFTYYDRTKTLFSGSDSVRNGRFAFSFAVPKDINYSDSAGLINLYAVSNDKQRTVNGRFDGFKVGGSALEANDSIGPSLYCYLNSTSFVNGDKVNTTPYFVAQISDRDGINVTGNSIGHDLELVIDGDRNRTYVLNDNFSFDIGSYTAGTTYYTLPPLTEGVHRLTFKAWDVLNNSSTATLTFRVVEGLAPEVSDLDVSKNPAAETTTFIVSHNRTGSDVTVLLEVFDLNGRLLWQHRATDAAATGSTYTYQWDLHTGYGGRLPAGLYLYRATVADGGGATTTKARKLVVAGNN